MQKILKVRFDGVTHQQATRQAIEYALASSQHYICTPNPEIVLKAQENNKYLKILNQSDLNIADGTGILWAAKYLSLAQQYYKPSERIRKFVSTLFAALFSPKSLHTVLPERVTGIDLMKSICQEAAKNNLPIFLLGAQEGIAKTAAKNLQQEILKLKIVGAHAGNPSPKNDQQLCKIINNAKPSIIFVAYGAPKQELWIARNLKHLKTVRLAMAVGGAFDFISKSKLRAPKWMQKSGLEWLFRLYQEPSRATRIYNAIVKFPFKILQKSLKS